MEIKDVLAIAGIILLLLGAIKLIRNASDYKKCVFDEKMPTDECLEEWVTKHPEVEDAQELEQACENSEEKCLIEVAKKKAINKAERTAEEELV